MIALIRRYRWVLVLVAATVAGLSSAWRMGDARIEELMRGKLVAGNLLTRIQLEGERMRRFEKEMFIYVQVAERRESYFKEFDTAHDRLLSDLTTAMAPSSLAFDESERAQMLTWNAALTTYTAAFGRLASAARSNDQRVPLPGQPVTTLDFNTAIGPAKDAFRVLLRGAEDMRNTKKTDPHLVAISIDRLIDQRMLTLCLVTFFGTVLSMVAWSRARGRVGGAKPALAASPAATSAPPAFGA